MGGGAAAALWWSYLVILCVAAWSLHVPLPLPRRLPRAGVTLPHPHVNPPRPRMKLPHPRSNPPRPRFKPPHVPDPGGIANYGELTACIAAVGECVPHVVSGVVVHPVLDAACCAVAKKASLASQLCNLFCYCAGKIDGCLGGLHCVVNQFPSVGNVSRNLNTILKGCGASCAC